MRTQVPGRFVAFPILALFLLGAASCGRQEPVRIGFVAGLSGKAADLGVAGRNGAQLAIEQRNAAGGIGGRPVEFTVRDDEQNPESARRAVADLIARRIELIIGPMTSSMAMAVLPDVDASKSVLLSPTVTTTELTGKDDNFLRVISDTTAYSSRSARFLYERLGGRTVAAVYDVGNRAYSESWLGGFRKVFRELGGQVVLEKPFVSAKDTVFLSLARELVASKAEAVLVIANAVDAATLCHQLRRLDPKVRIVMSEWASTERFADLAGEAAEGVVAPQFLDREDRSSRYLEFVKAYQARFGQAPGFAGTAGYDAATVALDAFAARKGKERVKEAILRMRSFRGLQQQLQFDRFGDAFRMTYVTTVKDGNFVKAE